MIALSDDQVKAVEKLERLKVGALFMDPGTGKTRVALSLVQSADTDFVLFLCPFQTKANLQAEIDKWGLSKPYRIEGIESLSNSDRLYLELRDILIRQQHPFLVVDESLKIKNRQAVRTQRVMDLGQLTAYRLLLNGTPLSRNVLDLWSQMQFLSPKILGMRYYEFMDKFVEYVRFNGSSGTPHTVIKAYANLDYLYSLIAPYVVDANLQLDIKAQHINFDYTISVEASDTYQAIKWHYLDLLSQYEDDTNIFMAMLTELQQSYCDDDGKVKQAVHLASSLGITDTLVFCKFIRSKDAIQKASPSLKVLTYGKGALGLNLQQYKHVIFYDKTFDYAQLLQAQRRVYRTGQDSNVTFHYMTANTGVERMIDNNIANKTNLLDNFKLAVIKGEERKLLDEL